MKNILILVLCIIANIGFSQINTFYVNPAQTDTNYTADQDSHLVVRNTTENNNNKLFLWIGGTGSKPRSYQTISNFAGNLGFDVINISYPNTVAAASLSNSSDAMAFDQYRQEICYGTPLSSDVSVDTLNSIFTRTVKLLNYLNTTYPTQNWDQYLSNPTSLDWSKIAIGGHSQGAGHSCYFAKFHSVERALMLSGPNDYSEHFSAAANWLRISGVSAMNKHFAYLSLLDELVPFEQQLNNLEGLGLSPLYDTIHVDMSDVPFSNSHCLYTTQDPGFLLNHSATVRSSSINREVWTYMLTSDITTSTSEIKDNSLISIYPNPVYSFVNIFSDDDLQDKTYLVINLAGQVVLKGKSPNTDLLSIDCSSLDNGMYFVVIDKQTSKVIKL